MSISLKPVSIPFRSYIQASPKKPVSEPSTQVPIRPRRLADPQCYHTFASLERQCDPSSFLCGNNDRVRESGTKLRLSSH